MTQQYAKLFSTPLLCCWKVKSLQFSSPVKHQPGQWVRNQPLPRAHAAGVKPNMPSIALLIDLPGVADFSLIPVAGNLPPHQEEIVTAENIADLQVRLDHLHEWIVGTMFQVPPRCSLVRTHSAMGWWWFILRGCGGMFQCFKKRIARRSARRSTTFILFF